MAITVLKNTPIHCVVAVSGTGATETIDISSTIVTATTRTFNGSSASVVDVDEDTITVTTHGFATGDRVVYSHGGGTQITGLTDGNIYYVVVVDSSTIKLAETYGNATATTPVVVNLTAVGVGTGHQIIKGQYGDNPTVNISGIHWAMAASNEYATVTRNSAVLWSLSGSNDLEFNGWSDNRANTDDIVVVTPATGGTVILELTKISGYLDTQHLNQNVN